MQSFKYVKIPADDSCPLEELTLEYKAEDEVRCLTEELKKYFSAQGGNVSKETEQESFKRIVQQQIEEKAKSGAIADNEIEEKVLDLLRDMQTVDIVTLLPATVRSNHEMVSFYLDDRGVAKDLPHNRRASELALRCNVPIQARGDVFVSRVMENNHNDTFGRRDFTLSDCKPSAEWIALAYSRPSEAVSGGASGRPLCHNHYCNNPGTLRCAACKKAHYCSAACQKEDWKIHKTDCHRL